MKHLRDSLSRMEESYVEISSLTSAEAESTYGGSTAKMELRDANCYGMEKLEPVETIPVKPVRP